MAKVMPGHHNNRETTYATRLLETKALVACFRDKRLDAVWERRRNKVRCVWDLHEDPEEIDDDYLDDEWPFDKVMFLTLEESRPLRTMINMNLPDTALEEYVKGLLDETV